MVGYPELKVKLRQQTDLLTLLFHLLDELDPGSFHGSDLLTQFAHLHFILRVDSKQKFCISWKSSRARDSVLDLEPKKPSGAIFFEQPDLGWVCP